MTALFSHRLDQTLTGIADTGSAPVARGARSPRFGSGDDGNPAEELPFRRDDGARPSDDDLANQFVVFQLGNDPAGPAILSAESVAPQLAGSDAAPDIVTRLSLTAFHLGAGEDVEPGTRATMRINFGKDPESIDRYFDTAFWAVAAGLKLYDEQSARPAQTKELQADLNRAFGNRPIEIPGGLGNLSFEVVKHEEPAWWKRLFGFLGSGAGTALTSVLGFPAVTTTAIGLIDELLGRLADDDHEVLFRSAPMRLALTQRAHGEFTGGNPRIRLGALNPGYCILARGRDHAALAAADAVFYPTFGLLAPAKLDVRDVANLGRDNPLNALTYAVFRVQMKSVQLDPMFNFRS